MNAKQIRNLNTEEINKRIEEESEQLEHLRFQHAIAPLENGHLLREKRRLVARLKTILNERKRAEQAA